MLVIPAEKRIDWRRPPYVIFGLVLINILIFVLNQSRDETHYQRAAELYKEQQFIEWEAPAYLTYLKQRGALAQQPELYQQYSEQLEQDPSSLSQAILFDIGFEEYLSNNLDQWLPDDKQSQWQTFRPVVSQNISALSSISFGFIPQQASLVTAISHQFLHGGFMHLLGNMVFLIICGFTVEAALGPGRFLLFYLLSGIAGGLAFAGIELLAGRGGSPLVGASGAISGVMAMYLMLYRLQKIDFFYWVVVFVGYFRAPALLILPLYIGKELLAFFDQESSGVAYMAHVGGFVAGALLVAFIQWRRPEHIDQQYLEDEPDQDPRLESLATILNCVENSHFTQASKALVLHQQSFGNCQQSDFIRLNLLSLADAAPYQEALLQFLGRSNMDPELIANQHRLWLRGTDKIKPLMDEQSLTRLGMRFMGAQYYDSSEAIALDLIKQNNINPQLNKLLGQLVGFYRDCDNTKRQQYFDTALEQRLEAGK